MPYRINPKDPKEVQVKKGGKWVSLKRYATAEMAQKRLSAMRINVSHGGK